MTDTGGVPPRVCSFLTDYGLQDGFPAACHGVVATLAPLVRVVDITHLVPPQDVRRGAAVLAGTAPSFPPGSVHLAVVDPGVGTERRPVAVVTARGDLLVGPDNGLLPPAADRLGGAVAAHVLANPRWWAPEVSRTFHGRDVFAPAAARLALGLDVREAGPALDPAELVRLPEPVCRVDAAAGLAEGEVVTVDHFGNVQTSLPGAALADLGLAPGTGGWLRLDVDGRAATEAPYAVTFGAVRLGELVALVDSGGWLALAVNGGSAAARLGVAAGDAVTVRPATATPAGSRPR